MYKLYSMQRSGNSYKVRLALALLNAPYRAIEIDILRGESRTPDFLAKNPSGQVPLLEVAEGRYLAESNAILWYVAGGTSLAPETRIERAEALQWMFFEQHALEPNIGAAYFWLSLVKGGRDLQTHALEDWMERGYAALQVMENHLKTHEYFATGQLTVADIALYGYTHVADRCDYDLAAFPAIRDWLRRVEQTPGFVTMDWRPGARSTTPASRRGLNTENGGQNGGFRRDFAIFEVVFAAILPATCDNSGVASDLPAQEEIGHDTVVRRSRLRSRPAPVASSRLIDAVAASLAIGWLSLCLIVTLTVFSIKVRWRCRFRRNQIFFGLRFPARNARRLAARSGHR